MVERWLIEVEKAMVDSVRLVISKSIEAYASQPRRQWVLHWPGQVVLCVSSIYWTSEVPGAMTVPDGIQVSML